MVQCDPVKIRMYIPERVTSLSLMTALLLSKLSGSISPLNPCQSASAHPPNAANAATCQKLSIVTYTPNNGFTGTDSFSYKATTKNGQGVDSDIAKVTITVNAPPLPLPTADNKMIMTNKGSPVQITLTGTDPIQEDVLKFSTTWYTH